MANSKTDLQKSTEKAIRLMKKLDVQLLDLNDKAKHNELGGIYEECFEAIANSEKLAVTLRAVPVLTGRPSAKMDLECVLDQEVPVEMGYTAKGWFVLKMPLLPSKKNRGSADYVRGYLYPAVERFFKEDQIGIRYDDCVLIFRHVYSWERPEHKYRDHDNIELNMVVDTIAVKVMIDDAPMKCRHYYCSAPGMVEQTEVYVVPRKDFRSWLDMEDRIPEGGLKIEKTVSFLRR